MMRALFCVLFVVAGLVPVGSAVAAPSRYALQIGQSRPVPLVLDGDQVTGLTIDVAPQGCATGDPRNSSDSLWRISISAADRVSLSGGRFFVSGEAPSAYYPGGSADFTVSGTVTQDHRVVTGTITIANGHDPFLSGCSATNTFLPVPQPTKAPGWGAPRNRTSTSQFLSFDYHAGIVSKLVLQANFRCGSGADPSVDEAEIDADQRTGRVGRHRQAELLGRLPLARNAS